MPSQIEDIKNRMTALDNKTDKIKLDADKMPKIQANLNKKIREYINSG